MALDPFAQHSVASLKALGPRVIVELMGVVEKRADINGDSFRRACSQLPPSWRVTMLIGHMVGQFEIGDGPAAALWDLETDADRKLVMAALKEIGEGALAAQLAAVAAELDFSAEDLDDNEGVGKEEPPEPEVLARIRKKLIKLAGGMDVPFPGLR